MPYCENCGAEVGPNSKFCRNCGAAQPISLSQTTANVPPQVAKPIPTVQPPPLAVQPAPSTSQTTNVPPPPPPVVQSVSTVPPPPPPPPVAQSFQTVPPPPVQRSVYVQVQAPSGERVLGVMVLRKPKSLGIRDESYTGVVTNQRMIFAQMTGKMVTDAVQMARDQAKAEGKGFWGQWSDQLKTSFTYSQRYLAMQPSAILAETPGNFAVDNNAIREVKIKDESGRGARDEFKMEIHSFSGNYEFKMDQRDEYINLLKQVYGQRVKMPFGTFRFHGVKIGL
jgi:hypothetical protein